MIFSVESAASEQPTRVALVHEGRSWTFADLAREVRAALPQDPTHEDRFAVIRAVPEIETLLRVYALLEAKTPFLPLHARLTESEATTLEDDARDCIEKTSHLDDRALAVIFTSGTSGRSRAAILSRAAFEASARASEANLPWREDDRWLLCMPLSHVGGLSIVTRTLAARRTVVFQPRFDAVETLETITRDHVTRISVVPTMLFDLLARDHQNVLARLRTVLVGGAAASPTLLQECAARGVRALTTYGLTEACSQVTTQAPRDPSVVELGNGRSLSGIELTILDRDRRPTKPAEIGSISIRGPQLMDGYLDAPPLLGTPFDTGDLGMLDDRGLLHVLSRRHDLIVSGGENIYPLEVEAALCKCAGVRAAIVFGVDHERWGQEVCAALVVDDRFDDERAMLELRRSFAAFKCPKRVAIATEFPIGASGKIARSEVVRVFTPTLRPWRSP